jgi:putative N6-adenine-specific DNA methylase
MLQTPLRSACYAIVTPGIEEITAAELRSLGLAPSATEPGGVSFDADLAGLYAANLHLRTASRVVRRVATFRASTFHELERRARRVPWASFLVPGRAAAFRVTSRKSRLYHGRAIEQRLREWVGAPVAAGEEDGQLFVVRAFRDEFTVSVDTSGALLHRRGYRLATAKAPLRETLAAAMLLDVGWDGSVPLLDPMCGSGTIPIEAALIARRMPPGAGRTFAFEGWPEFDAVTWRRVLADAEERVLPRAAVPISGSDRDAGAIAAAQENAARAGVTADVRLDRRAVSAIEPPAGPGWVVSNPPYGGRVGDRGQLRDLYAQIGHTLRRRCPGWKVALLSAHRELERHTALVLEPSLALSNGGIPVRLVQGTVPDQPPTVSPPKMGSTSPVM